jgi:hypothetical protein
MGPEGAPVAKSSLEEEEEGWGDTTGAVGVRFSVAV